MDSQVELSSNNTLNFTDIDPLVDSLHYTDEESTLESTHSHLCPESKKIHKKRTKYQRIDDNLRQKLIDAVEKDGQMLKAAAKKFKINYSSAKSIFHTYRKEGRVNKKAVRERYVKKHVNPAKLSQSTSISSLTPDTNPAGLKSVKENYNYSLLNLNKTKENIPKQELSPSMSVNKDYKTAQIEALTNESKLALQNLLLPSIERKLQNHMGLNNSLAIPNYNILQQLLAQQQASTLQQYEGMMMLQRALNPLSLFVGKPQISSFPMNQMLALEEQAMNIPFGLRNLDLQKALLTNGTPLMKGYPNLDNIKK